MKVTERIDALETMALDPIRFLAMPRFIAGAVMLPVLTIFANFVAITGALFVAILFIDISSYTF
jgi:phospholipid/cholesterol/gamma-HCH transport system permease protein